MCSVDPFLPIIMLAAKTQGQQHQLRTHWRCMRTWAMHEQNEKRDFRQLCQIIFTTVVHRSLIFTKKQRNTALTRRLHRELYYRSTWLYTKPVACQTDILTCNKIDESPNNDKVTDKHATPATGESRGGLPAIFQIPEGGSTPILFALMVKMKKNRARGPWLSPANACLRLWLYIHSGYSWDVARSKIRFLPINTQPLPMFCDFKMSFDWFL